MNQTSPPSIENKHCDNLSEITIINNTVSYCDTNGNISNYACPTNEIWNDDYAQCSTPNSKS